MNRDRGSIKWTSMMLPEHVKLIKDFYENDYYSELRPEIDEQTMEHMMFNVLEAFHNNSIVELSYWPGSKLEVARGSILRIIPTQQSIQFKTNEDFIITIKFSEMIDINIQH